MAILGITELEEQFQKDMQHLLENIRAKGWTAPRFAQMMNRNDARDVVKATKSLLVPREFPSGTFSVPELTVEYYVIRDEYRTLFTSDERAIAWWRLKPEEA